MPKISSLKYMGILLAEGSLTADRFSFKDFSWSILFVCFVLFKFGHIISKSPILVKVKVKLSVYLSGISS